MARDREERDVSDRLAEEIAGRVVAAISAEFDQLRRGMVELAGSVAELHSRQQALADQVGSQTTTAMVRVVDHVEALLAATGWAILDQLRNESGSERGRDASGATGDSGAPQAPAASKP